MKIGDVMRKEREGKTGLNRNRALGTVEAAAALGVDVDAYAAIEAGDPSVEKWFPILCKLAVRLEYPSTRLLADSGRARDCAPGQAGRRIRAVREDRGLTVEEIAEALGLSVAEYLPIERGQSELERVGPLMLAFAEAIEQPMFNLYLPCGVPYDQLHDYP